MWRRVGEGGVPGDLQFSRVLTFLPDGMVDRILEKDLQKTLDHNLYGLRPNHKPLSAHPTVNDDLPNQIINGRVVIKPNIKRFSAKSVKFEDGSEEEVDAVILATGYVFKFPFLPDLKVEKNEVSLYKNVFSPYIGHASSMAIIGLVQPVGSTIPIAEMQSRWAVRVFKGLTNLPSKEEMIRDITLKKQSLSKRYVTSQRHTIQVDVLPYLDDVAMEIGVKPDLMGTFKRDFKLWVKLMFGPSLNYQYRLSGPGKWDGARKAIETYWERVEAPFHTRKVDVPKNKSVLPQILLISVLILLLAYWMLDW